MGYYNILPLLSVKVLTYLCITNKATMKKVYFLSAFIFLLIFSAHADNLRAHINYSTFNIPGESPYIETYMLVEGAGATFIKNENNKYQATIEVLVLFKQGEKIIEFNKYEFNSPELTDTLSNVHNMINFMDQQRYMLPNGEYSMEFEISDKYTNKKPLKTTQNITINYPEKEVVVSDIMFVESFSAANQQSMLTRGGYNIIPGVFSFYPDNRNELIFYAEVYNTDKILGAGEAFAISAFVENKEAKTKVEGLGKMSREKANGVIMSLNKFDIKKLPSGNFNVVIEIRDRNNNLIASQKQLFQRSNPRQDIQLDGVTSFSSTTSIVQGSVSTDSLREAIRALIPRASDSELIFIKNKSINADRETLVRFFNTFWVEHGGSNAAYEWNEYYKLVQYAANKFSNGFNRGYETGRGYYFCKFGQPDHVLGNSISNVVYPYEIWHYYEADDQRDVKFVFYTRDIATKTYDLLHTNLIGELDNPHWVQNLWRMESQGYSDYDSQFDEYMNYYGNQILEEFNSPY